MCLFGAALFALCAAAQDAAPAPPPAPAVVPAPAEAAAPAPAPAPATPPPAPTDAPPPSAAPPAVAAAPAPEAAPAAAPEAAPAPAPDPNNPQQVVVSVKIVEFQTTKGVETGLSAYFAQRNKVRAWGRVSSGNGNIRNMDLTFPNTVGSAITVFLDNIEMNYGDLEIVLQGLVDQNRAFILSQPKAMVAVGSATPTQILTTQKIGYENTVAVGAAITQITSFRETGVSLAVLADEVVDDDGDSRTTEDTYIRLRLSASVNEEGQRIVVALADQSGALSNNAIRVPEFVSRSMGTCVWVRHGQVLLLGGLFRNTENKNLSTLPWLTQTEEMAMGLAQRLIPPARALGSPLSSTLGNRSTSEGRRELVFLVKAEFYDASKAVFSGGFEEESRKKPGLQNVIQDISEIPQGIVQGITGTQPGTEIDSSLGGDK
ncbi:MAG TPA: hypothetical protein VMZ06_12275 [Candidatus Bathyarchaeia archaeon]|nr:hypothetical protein [Candidatus Bathyarchaeia archaeon]